MKPASGQLSMFAPPKTGRDAYAEAEKPAVPLNSSVKEEDKPRLSKQQRAVLERLRQGRATNLELNPIAYRYSARLNELKEHGVIKEYGYDTIGPGVNLYWITE